MSKAATAMATKERPILFSAEMVRAILEGRKTQTRRLVKNLPPPVILQSDPRPYDRIGYCHYANNWQWKTEEGYCRCRKEGAKSIGFPGDRLWVRETLKPKEESAANGAPRGVWAYYAADNTPCPGNQVLLKTTPAIFMPRWASRITLEIESIHVERLHEISEAGARAEGITAHSYATGIGERFKNHLNDNLPDFDNARDSFRSLWDRINGKKEPWASNPWVWVIKFKRVDSGS